MAIFFASCSNMNLNMDEEAVVSFEISNNERTAFPAIELANLSNFEVEYKKAGDASFTSLTTAKDYATLQSQKFTMKPDTYSFALTAECGGFMYKASIDGKKISAQEPNVLEFTLNMDSYDEEKVSGEGDLVIKIKVPLEFDVQNVIQVYKTFNFVIRNEDISVAISPSDAPDYKVFTINKKNIPAGLHLYTLTLEDSFGNTLDYMINDAVYISDKNVTKAEYTVDSFETSYTKEAILSGVAGEHLNWYLVPYKEISPFGSARKVITYNAYDLYIVGTGNMYNYKFPASLSEYIKLMTYGMLNMQEEVKDYLSKNSVDFESPLQDYMIMTVYVSDDVTSIGDCAFIPNVISKEPSGIRSIEFTENSKLESIGALSFLMEMGMLQFDIPQTVTSIGYGAFCGCEGFYSTEQLREETIESIPENCDYDPETLFMIPCLEPFLED